MSNNKILFKLRQEKNISQDFLARLIGVSRPTYALLESGRKELTISQAQKICDYFQISFTHFTQGTILFLASIKNTKKKNHSLKNKQDEFVRIDVPQEKAEVLREVLLYILNKVGGKPNIGQTVIYKLLYFIDFDFYELYERQFIGAKYMHNHYGPTPVGFDEIIIQMEKDEEIEQIKSKYFQYPQTKYLALREPNLSIIGDALAVKHLDKEIERLSDKSAHELTELSHQDVPWISAHHGEVLDYEAVFYRTADTSVRAYHGDTLI